MLEPRIMLVKLHFMTWTLTCQGEVMSFISSATVKYQMFSLYCIVARKVDVVFKIWFDHFIFFLFPENMQLQLVKTGTSGMS